MGVTSVPASSTIYDRLLRRIQKQLANRVKIPFEIRLWSDSVYRFGEGEPAVDILVRDRKGLALPFTHKSSGTGTFSQQISLA